MVFQKNVIWLGFKANTAKTNTAESDFACCRHLQFTTSPEAIAMPRLAIGDGGRTVLGTEFIGGIQACSALCWPSFYRAGNCT
jgi:hypothetical protein